MLRVAKRKKKIVVMKVALSICLILAVKAITLHIDPTRELLYRIRSSIHSGAYFADITRKRPPFRAPRLVAYERVDC